MKYLKKRLLCIFFSILMLIGIYQPKDGCDTLSDPNPRPETGEIDLDE